jgi:hypothetical protein
MAAKSYTRILENGFKETYTLIPERYYIDVHRPSDVSVDQMKEYVIDALKDWCDNRDRSDIGPYSPFHNAKFGIVRVERRPKPAATIESAMSVEHMLDMGKDKTDAEVVMEKAQASLQAAAGFAALSELTFAGMSVKVGLTVDNKRQIIIQEV